ncbi:MAG: voltage-gated potassium channel [Planctomycetota bacterium]|jgi:voltage-gated potassium channel
MGRNSANIKRFCEEAIQRRRAMMAFALLIAVALFGTIGFRITESWPVWRCFYFTVITVSTVGYGDGGMSDAGAKFATFLLIFGIGAASFAFSVLLQYTLNRESLWRRRMRNRVEKTEDHVIVVGFGRMGESLCEELRREDHTFVVIEMDKERAKSALEHGYFVVEGSATEDECLIEAGVERAKHIVTLAGREDFNIVIALTARELSNDIEIIARAESEKEVRKLRRAGANKVISPFQTGGVTISKMITHPRVAEFLSVSGSGHANVALAEIKVEASSSIIGKSLREFGQQMVPHVCFVALERDDHDIMIPPRGEETFRADDLLIVAGDPEEIAAMKDSGRRLLPVNVG